MQCLTKSGSVLISEEVAEKLLPKFSRKAEIMGVHIKAVASGTIEQLHELVKLVSNNEVPICFFYSFEYEYFSSIRM